MNNLEVVSDTRNIDKLGKCILVQAQDQEELQFLLGTVYYIRNIYPEVELEKKQNHFYNLFCISHEKKNTKWVIQSAIVVYL